MICALLAAVVKRGSPEQAILLVVAATVIVFAALKQPAEEVMQFLEELGTKSGVPLELFVPLYKTIGIAFVVRIGGSLCKDTGESALSSMVETAGAFCALLVSLPLFRAVLDLLLELMK